ncbi:MULTISPECIES: NlpC/P60 family protein [Amycolatopsis]|uniref:NlpC/P60 family protein n=1 Tax=Amycolatopsis rubida TaxID=112413 RepID=A0A1I5ZWE6_9PSEU|nr:MULTISPECIES: NlpC/P60 family protein [Amycolatopsis]OAP20532.1 Peptidoglycan endopeptidase RipA precursor [Amycolatopsis sp. M39]SFQ60653.1 NlpC/P60 family protein [Amycolatopsis rubida]
MRVRRGRSGTAGALVRGAGARRGLAIATVTLAALLGATSTGLAAPPPPPNPSDSSIDSAKGDANAKAGEVGKLTNQLAQAEQKLSALQDDVELKQEQAMKALVDLQTAQDEATQAHNDAKSARQEADAAVGAIEKARADAKKFAAASFEQGSTIGSISAYLTSDSPKDLLARAQLLDAIGGSRLNAMDRLQQAQTEKANKDSAARKALELAQQKQDAATRAKGTADAAQSAAVSAQQAQAAQNTQLEASKNSVEQQLYAAQAKVNGLQGQRQRYQDWLAQKQREDEERARQAALRAAAANNDGGGDNGGGSRGRPSPAAGSSIEAVIARALSKVGMPYAWGGGNGSGPTRGIRDGGVADRYGDYRKIGFDCSGLMIYAFAGVQGLPHFSGYQYTSGRRVPLSQMRRGDMLFWGGSGGIHHVALYLGNGQMVEAPQSGSYVRVTSVRYGGIMPYATRLIG